jgi:aspartate aminotransferase-like enzyme
MNAPPDADRIVLSPGPVHVSPGRFRDIYPLHHRSSEFRRIVIATEGMIRELIASESPVYFVTASGTGAMEMAIVNVTDPGTKLLVVACGKFGERWAEIARAYGCRCERITFDPGAAADVERILAAVERFEPEILALTHVESSTGLLLPLAELLGRLGEPRPLVVVDAISSIGVEAFAMDEMGIDVTVGAVQKAFAAPPGLGFVSFGERARAASGTVTRGRYYFDLERYERGREHGDTPFTPAVQCVQMTQRSLSRIGEIGWEEMKQRHRRASRAFLAASRTLGLDSLAQHPSDAVQALVMPDGCDGVRFVETLAEREGITIANGQGPLRGRIVRSGFLGLHGYRVMLHVIKGLYRALHEVGHDGDIGAAIRELEVISDLTEFVW